jgi:hypothetical protein
MERAPRALRELRHERLVEVVAQAERRDREAALAGSANASAAAGSLGASPTARAVDALGEPRVRLLEADPEAARGSVVPLATIAAIFFFAAALLSAETTEDSTTTVGAEPKATIDMVSPSLSASTRVAHASQARSMGAPSMDPTRRPRARC